MTVNIIHNETLKSKKGFLIFLCIYGIVTILLIIGLICLLHPLNQKLGAYEAAQLKSQAAQTFNQLFATPDWNNIYKLSEMADTPFENSEDFVSYMESQTGGKTLTYREVLSPNPQEHKYLVLLDSDPIAAFTMTGGASSPADMPQWSLIDVEILAKPAVSVTVEKLPEHTVYINGTALDDSFTVRTVETKAEPYLPEGVHGYRRVEQRVDGLLSQPEILVLDADGAAVPIALNPETGIYTLQLPTPAQMTEEEEILIAEEEIALRRPSGQRRPEKLRSLQGTCIRQAPIRIFAGVSHENKHYEARRSFDQKRSRIFHTPLPAKVRVDGGTVRRPFKRRP